MQPSYIGWWAARQGTKWHLVESEVTDRLVMRCGRQMKMLLHERTMRFLPYTDLPVTDPDICRQCDRPYAR